MKILIVEDELIPANYLKRVLQKEGYEVLGVVKSGKEAINKTKELKPDIIFMDIMLEDNISGADAAVEINSLYPNIIIIFLTAFSDKEMIEFAVRSNAFAYLLKPYRENEILATIELAKSKQNISKYKNDKASIIKLVDNYHYNLKLNRLFLGTKEIELGPKAMQLIKLLCENKNITLEIDNIIKILWNTPKSKQTLRSLIHRIRSQTTNNLIVNVNKFGYKIGLE